MRHVSYEVADTSLVTFYSVLALVCAAAAAGVQLLQPDVTATIVSSG
jgi:hypothetical protein